MLSATALNRNKIIKIGESTCYSENSRKYLIVDEIDGYYILQELYRADRKLYTITVSPRRLYSRFLLD